jgi:hypothetical protein
MKFPFLLVLAAALCGCGESSGRIILYTNRQEIAVYAETFNSMQDRHRLEIHYRENTPSALDFSTEVPDLVIMDNLSGETSAKRFVSLDSLFGGSGIDRRAFYASLLRAGQREKKQTLIPVSFNLPALMFDARISGDEASLFMINLESLAEKAAAANRKNDSAYLSMGFAPRWNSDFLVQASLMRGAAFKESPETLLAWDGESLDKTLEYFLSWSEKYNGGGAAEITFAEKYLYDPPYRQLALGRIKYAYTTAADFFLVPESYRNFLDVKWLSHAGKITATERILFAGIPQGADNARGAEAFLRWFFCVPTQSLLLEKSREKMPGVFGIASGFSSLKEINEKHLPLRDSALSGFAPPEDVLVFPAPVPYLWNRIKTQVLVPWMQKRISPGGQHPEDLAALFQGWLQ